MKLGVLSDVAKGNLSDSDVCYWTELRKDASIRFRWKTYERETTYLIKKKSKC